MKFIKKTFLLTSKSSSNIQALCPQNQHNNNINTDKLQEQLRYQYERMKASLKITRNQHKYQAYFSSFQVLLDIKDSMINKKIDSVMSTLHLSNKKKQKQIPLIEAFTSLSIAQRYKFLIDLMKYAQEYQRWKCKCENIGSKRRIWQRDEQQQINKRSVSVISQAWISLNQLKPMSLSYWTRVQFELSLSKREFKVTGKQSFILYLQNYLIRLSNKQKNCFVLLSCNRDQTPSWLRKVYITLKTDIFIQIFQSIWIEIVCIQVEKMMVSFDEVNNNSEVDNFTRGKSLKQIELGQDRQQLQVERQMYMVFLTPFAIRAYFDSKSRFLTKLPTKLSKLQIFKQIQYNLTQLFDNTTRQKLSKIQFLKSIKDNQRSTHYQVYQVKGYFRLPASVVKFKFIDALKERNRLITSWEILQAEMENNLQVVSQTMDFTTQFYDFIQSTTNTTTSTIDYQNILRFKQLFIKEQSVKINDDSKSQILALNSIGEISKNSFINFLFSECQFIREQKCCLIITAEFNKNFFKKKLTKSARQSVSKQQLVVINNKLIEIFLKEMILMLFNQQKKYEQTMLNHDQQFFTICEAFTDQLEGLGSESGKSERQEDESQSNVVSDINIRLQPNCRSETLISFKKPSIPQSNEDEQFQVSNNLHLSMRKSTSLTDTLLPPTDSPLYYLLHHHILHPSPKPNLPQLVTQNLLDEDWKRLQQGGLTTKNQEKIKQQKQIIKKILMNLGENLLKQKNIMHVSLPVTIFKPQSQLVTVARGLTYAPLLLQPQYYLNEQKSIDAIERVKKVVVFLISNSYAQVNFQKPFNPILGQTYQGWVDGCPVYYQQISHHPPVTYYYMLGRGYKIYGAIEPVLSLGLNNAKVTSWAIDCIEFQDGTKINAGPNKMMVNGTTFGVRTFNLQQKNFVYDLKTNILALFSYGPTRKGVFSTSSQPLDFVSGKIMKMTLKFQTNEYQKWRKSMNYTLKKEWIESEIGSFQGIWNEKLFFDGIQYFDFSKNLPFQLIEQKHPLPSDCRYRQDLQWLIKRDIDKSQFYKEKLQQNQRRDKKLRSTKNK